MRNGRTGKPARPFGSIEKAQTDSTTCCALSSYGFAALRKKVQAP